MRPFALPWFVACTPVALDDPPEAAPGLVDRRAVLAVDEGEVFRARVDGVTVWVQQEVQRAPGSFGGVQLQVRVRTSAPMRDPFTWIPDDGYGQVQPMSARELRVVFDSPSEVNTVLSGLPVFLSFDVERQGPPARLHVQLSLAPTIGPALVGGVQLTGVAPIFHRDPSGDTLRYRAWLTRPEGVVSLAASSAGLPPETAVVRGEGQLTWRFEGLDAALGGASVQLDVGSATGGLQRVDAQVGAEVWRVGVSRVDPYEVPGATAPPVCSAAALACASAAEGSDLAACGAFREVRACARESLCVEAGPGAWGLVPREDDGALFGALADFTAQCGAVDAGCAAYLSSLAAVDVCPAAGPVAFEDVVTAALEADFWLAQAGWSVAEGDRVEGGTIAGLGWFAEVGGAALLAQVEASLGAGPWVGWRGQRPGEEVVVILDEGSGAVVVLSGSLGSGS